MRFVQGMNLSPKFFSEEEDREWDKLKEEKAKEKARDEVIKYLLEELERDT